MSIKFYRTTREDFEGVQYTETMKSAEAVAAFWADKSTEGPCSTSVDPANGRMSLRSGEASAEMVSGEWLMTDGARMDIWSNATVLELTRARPPKKDKPNG